MLLLFVFVLFVYVLFMFVIFKSLLFVFVLFVYLLFVLILFVFVASGMALNVSRSIDASQALDFGMTLFHIRKTINNKMK